jgi:RNA polymerase sigma-70 factor (ECF subfamily)
MTLAKVNPRYRLDPEVRLMLRVKRDPAAFRELLSRYRARVVHQLFAMVGNREEAEDLAQEVFLRVFRHRHNYQPRAKFATWLFRIVQNMGRNALRDRRRHPACSLHAPIAPDDHSGLESTLSDLRIESPWHALDRWERCQMLRWAMGHLTTRQREALEMQQFEDRSHAEIAARLTLSTKAAKSLLYRARLQLREVLTPYMVVE